MKRYRYAVIGTGLKHGMEGATGYGMSNTHMHGFKLTGRVDLVGIADINESHARAFLKTHELSAPIYSDYCEMLEKERPDIVSVAVWPKLHAPATIAAIEAGAKAVHCEKPMAPTWYEAKAMKASAEAHGVILTFNHQRRFLDTFQNAKRLIDEGQIGTLERVEGRCNDMFDWGTHWLDMMFFMNNETPAEWVLAQIDGSTIRRVYGAPIENQGFCLFGFKNGVTGLLFTGHKVKASWEFRICGSEGVIELHQNAPNLLIRGKGDGALREVETHEGLHDEVSIDRATADLIKALDEPGYEPLLSVNHAIQHTEVIFAAYESSRRRRRIELPLTAEGNALEEMIASGEMG